jgi:hypothetical protein
VTGTLYASLPELKQYLAIPDEASDVDLERALDVASRKIDGECGRAFGLETAQTRLFYPQSAWVTKTPDLVAVTTLKTDPYGDQTFARTLTTTDYELWPLNEGRYQEIRIRPLAQYSFTTGRYVQVVGSFGCVVDGGAPVEVRQSALILASRYYKRSEAPFGVLQNTDLGQYTRLSQSDPDVSALLAPWRLTGSSWVMI